MGCTWPCSLPTHRVTSAAQAIHAHPSLCTQTGTCVPHTSRDTFLHIHSSCQAPPVPMGIHHGHIVPTPHISHAMHIPLPVQPCFMPHCIHSLLCTLSPYSVTTTHSIHTVHTYPHCTHLPYSLCTLAPGCAMSLHTPYLLTLTAHTFSILHTHSPCYAHLPHVMHPHSLPSGHSTTPCTLTHALRALIPHHTIHTHTPCTPISHAHSPMHCILTVHCTQSPVLLHAVHTHSYHPQSTHSWSTLMLCTLTPNLMYTYPMPCTLTTSSLHAPLLCTHSPDACSTLLPCPARTHPCCRCSPMSL